MKDIRRPPEAALAAAAARRAAEREAIRNARRAAFAAEADPVAFKMLRGEATAEDYAATVEAIRARHPYPEESQDG